ncbi:hypothetical protein [Nonlabens agnitus]|uniref:Uncharacterized protein n=1 Tax=Nonlabens agnitus TaxID=870484 RepID=A0A2S9WS04_9FLAO|nr:hypothetical protein [Nonlabens agnitus]PRP66272.1 hypothetical protein BST86_03780 [Nonlabens agnitus]
MHINKKIAPEKSINLSECYFNPKNGKPYTYEQVCIIHDYDGPRTDPNDILKNHNNDRALIDFVDDKAIQEAKRANPYNPENKLFPDL